MDKRLENVGIKRFLAAIADLAFPRVCIVCGCGLMPMEKHLCISCAADLPETRFSCMSHNQMADCLNEKIESHRAKLGLDFPEEYSFAAALFYYKSGSGYERITQELKYFRNFSAGRYFARTLGARIHNSGLYADVDCVIPVPLHWTRRWKRGYNQAEIIAREIADELVAPCLPDALLRRRRTQTQTHLGREAKAKNVSGAFTVKPGNLKTLSGFRHVLIVDDVFTTGATLSECHIALRSALGPTVRISVATLAFVG